MRDRKNPSVRGRRKGVDQKCKGEGCGGEVVLVWGGWVEGDNEKGGVKK